MGALILYSREYKVWAPVLDGSSDFVFELIQNLSPRAGWQLWFCILVNTKFEPLWWMGAMSLYSSEYKSWAPVLDGSSDFVFNWIQNLSLRAGWELRCCIQVNTKFEPPRWTGALILYSSEYKIWAPVLDGSSDFVFKLIHNLSPRAEWELWFCIQVNTTFEPPCWMGALILYSSEYKIRATVLGGSSDFVF